MTPDGYWKGFGTSKTKEVKEVPWERHYYLNELCKAWGFSRSTVKQWFKDEPGVLRHTGNTYRGRIHPYVSLRIPESVAMRVYKRHTEIHRQEEEEGSHE